MSNSELMKLCKSLEAEQDKVDKEKVATAFIAVVDTLLTRLGIGRNDAIYHMAFDAYVAVINHFYQIPEYGLVDVNIRVHQEGGLYSAKIDITTKLKGLPQVQQHLQGRYSEHERTWTILYE